MSSAHKSNGGVEHSESSRRLHAHKEVRDAEVYPGVIHVSVIFPGCKTTLKAIHT